MSGARLKGVAFKSLLRSLEVLRGKDVVERCIQACPTELRDALVHGKVVSAGWYSLVWYRELHVAISRTLSTGPDFARELSCHATRHDLQTIYKLASMLFSPETLVKHSMRLLRLYYEGGEVQILSSGPGLVRFKLWGFEGYNQLCWEDLLGGTLASLECSGAQDIGITRNVGGGDTDGLIDVTFTWRA
ncbi:MAG: hypothetical protein AB2A00_42135 [Myxococcota bacterium]